MVIFPLAPDQTIAQMWSNDRRPSELKANINQNEMQCCTYIIQRHRHGHIYKLSSTNLSQQTAWIQWMCSVLVCYYHSQWVVNTPAMSHKIHSRITSTDVKKYIQLKHRADRMSQFFFLSDSKWNSAPSTVPMWLQNMFSIVSQHEYVQHIIVR